MNKKQFIGSWRLISLENHRGEKVDYPMGKSAQGYLHYMDNGQVSVAIMEANRKNFPSDDVKGGDDDERARAYESFIGYSGKFEVKNNKVFHHVEVCSFPNWVGRAIGRNFQFKDGKLILHTDPFQFEGAMIQGILVWERC